MNVLQNVRSMLSGYFQTKETPKIENVSLLDVYSECIRRFVMKCYTKYKLEMLWIVQLVAFLFHVSLRQYNFYGLIALLALGVFIYDWLYREKLYAAYTGEYRELDQMIGNSIQDFIHYVCTLRKESQHIFYPMLLLFFWGVYHGHQILQMFTYLLFLYPVFLLIKCIILYLPERYHSKVQEKFESLGIAKFLDKDDYFFVEFVFELTMKRLFGLPCGDSDQVIFDEDSYIGDISLIPSYLELQVEPFIGLREEDLMPETGSSAISVTPGDLSSDSDSDSKDIKFDSNHFNTSSSEDDLLIKSFPTIAQVPVTSESVGMFRSVMNTVGSNIVANMFQSVHSQKPETRRQVSSDSDSSDFELVNAEDIENDMKKSA